jgi:hypothetical protein
MVIELTGALATFSYLVVYKIENVNSPRRR